MFKFLKDGRNLIILGLLMFVMVAIGGQSLYAIGTNLIENYQGIIKFNQGYYSDLPIQTTNTITGVGFVNTGTLTQSGAIAVSDGNLTLSSGVGSLTGETATSTLVEDILTLNRISATDYNTDGIGSGILFKSYDSNGLATSTARISVVMDDVTSNSDETSIIFEQLLDNGIALTNVFELDSGDMIFDTDTLFGDTSADRIGIGTSTPLSLTHIEDASATSTLTISSGSASSGGRIILEDTDGAGCSEISILDGTIIVETVTCPTGI